MCSMELTDVAEAHPGSEWQAENVKSDVKEQQVELSSTSMIGSGFQPKCKKI